MPETIKVGLIGAGGIANAHINAYEAINDVEIVALWNRTKSRAEELAQNRQLQGATVYDDWQTLLQNAHLDAVSIVTAPQLRVEPVRMALEKGIHTLVEKPFATTLQDADEMVATANASPCVTAVCFTWRYKSGILAARRTIRSGQIGEIRHYSSIWRTSLPANLSPSVRPYIIEAQGGLGLIGEQGSHEFDMVTFLTGQTLNHLTGHLSWVEAEIPDLRTNFTYHLVGINKQNVTISFEHTVPPGPVWVASQRQIYVEGTKGYAKIEGGLQDDGQASICLEEDKDALTIVPDRMESSVPPQHMGLVADFISAIRNNDQGQQRPATLPAFNDGLRSLEIVIGALKADRERRWVSIADLRG